MRASCGSFKRVLVGVALFSSRALAAEEADIRQFDTWETPDRYLAFQHEDCIPLGALALEVPDQARPIATSMLATQAALPLDDSRVAQLLPGGKIDVGQLSASAAEDLERQARDAERYRSTDPLGAAYSAMIAARDRLYAVEIRYAAPKLKPFLVRAVALNRGTGGFSAEQCGSVVVVAHVSLGRRWPTPQRAALVVFLTDAPREVIVTTSMAE